ncbi:MAG TPA: hypothetical protein VJA66_00085 [Thermoanaerobaculia bacterium]
MKMRIVPVFVCALALAAAATAQTKTSGTLQCSKSDPLNMVEVGDHPGHAFVLAKTACTWSKPMEIEGAQTKDGVSVGTEEMNGGKSSGSGSHWSNMSSGDKIFVRFQGKSTYDKDGKMLTSKGTWSYTGGSGKLKGIKGKGTYDGKGSPDGTATYAVEGDYTLPK